MIRTLVSCSLVLLAGTAASAQAPQPIPLLLSPAKPPTPPLRYQLLPDGRLLTPDNAATVYQQVIDQLAQTPVGPNGILLSEWRELPPQQLPRDAVRKELAVYDKVYALLDKAARCERCDWGLRERLRQKGIGTLLPEIQPLRQCALLLSLKVHLEIAEGRSDKAISTLRSGFALARNVGDAETLIHFLVGIALASIMEGDVDLVLSQPDAPNLYYALTNLPTPLFSMRKSVEGERICCIEGTFPRLAGIATNLDAGNLSNMDLAECVKIVDGLGKTNDQLPPSLRRLYLAWQISNKHEIAKQALVDAGRPRDKVEAMSPVQVALLHALLEYDTALENLIVWQNLPYGELSQRINEVYKSYLEDRWKNPKASAVPLTPLILPAVKKVAFAGARSDRKIALLRTIEAAALLCRDARRQVASESWRHYRSPSPPGPGNGPKLRVHPSRQHGDIARPTPRQGETEPVEQRRLRTADAAGIGATIRLRHALPGYSTAFPVMVAGLPEASGEPAPSPGTGFGMARSNPATPLPRLLASHPDRCPSRFDSPVEELADERFRSS